MTMDTPATLLCDFYKISHRESYPPGTEVVYSTWIPRESRMPGVDHVVQFGIQAFIQGFLVDYFNEHFFSRDTQDVVDEYADFIAATLGDSSADPSHIRALHELGYLPLEVKALPEGTLTPLRVPMAVVENTDPRFFWLTNYIETLWSCEVWHSATSATTAHEYRKLLDAYALETTGSTAGVEFQCHDFSIRGMTSLESAAKSGAAHMLSFVGSDNIPGIFHLEKYYGADVTTGLVGTSIPATEHSVMCAYGQNEHRSYKRLLTEVYPTGLVSIVSDTWDLWSVMTLVIPSLHKEIMARDGKFVVRPDSGDPVDIICGTLEGLSGASKTDVIWASDAPGSHGGMHPVPVSGCGACESVQQARARLAKIPQAKGVIELLWDEFGGTVNEQGYKVLDPHVGAIYGDSITPERARAICERLKQKGFASTNVVFGVGSYTYQYTTRDVFGFAMKSTWCRINGESVPIFKDPATDKNKVKKSLKGRVVVVKGFDKLVAIDGLDEETEKQYDSLLETVFRDGTVMRHQNLAEIRSRLGWSV